MRILATSMSCVAAIVGAALLALGLSAVPAYAQIGTAAAKKDAGSEQIIVSNPPEQQSRVRKLLSRLLGKTKTEKLKTTGSEVVSVPKGKSAWLEKRLERVGAKVTRLRENWNHILMRPKEDVPLTPPQKSAIDTASKSPETVNVRRAQDAERGSRRAGAD
jgi:hypothetical protein